MKFTALPRIYDALFLVSLAGSHVLGATLPADSACSYYLADIKVGTASLMECFMDASSEHELALTKIIDIFESVREMMENGCNFENAILNILDAADAEELRMQQQPATDSSAFEIYEMNLDELVTQTRDIYEVYIDQNLEKKEYDLVISAGMMNIIVFKHRYQGKLKEKLVQMAEEQALQVYGKIQDQYEKLKFAVALEYAGLSLDKPKADYETVKARLYGALDLAREYSTGPDKSLFFYVSSSTLHYAIESLQEGSEKTELMEAFKDKVNEIISTRGLYNNNLYPGYFAEIPQWLKDIRAEVNPKKIAIVPPKR
jgi:hypothetical protein